MKQVIKQAVAHNIPVPNLNPAMPDQSTTATSDSDLMLPHKRTHGEERKDTVAKKLKLDEEEETSSDQEEEEKRKGVKRKNEDELENNSPKKAKKEEEKGEKKKRKKKKKKCTEEESQLRVISK